MWYLRRKSKSLSETHYFYNGQDLSVGKSVEKNSSNEKWTGHFETGINNPAGWTSAPVKDLAVERETPSLSPLKIKSVHRLGC